MDMHQDANHRLALAGELTIHRAEAIKAAMLAALGDGDLELDLSAVVEVDTSGVQLLLSLAKTLATRGGALRMTAVSAPVMEAVGLLGVDHRFAA